MTRQWTHRDSVGDGCGHSALYALEIHPSCLLSNGVEASSLAQQVVLCQDDGVKAVTGQVCIVQQAEKLDLGIPTPVAKQASALIQRSKRIADVLGFKLGR